MNKRALQLGLLYSLLVILFKIYLLQSGLALSRFGFYYANLIAVLCILPFYVLLVARARKKDYAGQISGREAFRLCLSLFVVGITVISIYNYIEFSLYGKEMATAYYSSDAFLDFLKNKKQIAASDYQKIITEQIREAASSAFKATTGKVLTFLLIGVSGAFITSVFMKRSAVR